MVFLEEIYNYLQFPGTEYLLANTFMLRYNGPNCLFGSLRVGARSTISVIQITSDTQVRSLSAFLFFFSYICFHSKRRLIFMIFKNMINIFFITDEF
jgi:hypothetical protein